MPGTLFVIFFFVAIAIAIFAIIQNSKRRQAWQQFANNHGFSYLRYDTVGLPAKYAEYQLFKVGDSRKAYNLCMGKNQDLAIYTFDYEYSTGSGKERSTSYFTCITVESPLLFRPLYIRPESFFDKIGAAIGFDSIHFESAEFSKKFHVKCEDKKFAYDIIHTRMMEFLLQSPPVYIESHFQTVLFHRNKQLSISEAELLLIESQKFFELTPDYVKQDNSLQSRTT